MLARAKAVGVDVLQPCRVVRPIVFEGRTIGVETFKGNFTASFVIDAAGSHHWLAKQLGLELKTHSDLLMSLGDWSSALLDWVIF